MKRLQLLILAALAVSVVSCNYGIPDTDYKTLAPIEIVADNNVYAKQGVEFVFDYEVKSDREVSYEWCYGAINGSFPQMRDSMVISHTKEINHTFLVPGNYVLRLKADNGESCIFKYFNFTVQAGFDRGIMVLCENEQGEGSLGFIKYRTPQEIADGEQYIWDDILETLNPDMDLKNPTDIYLTSYKDTKSLIIGSKNPARVYKFNPATVELESVQKMDEEYPGSEPLQFIGEYSASADYYCFIASSDTYVYRYDFYADLVGLRSNSMAPVTKGYQGYDGSAKKPFLYSDTHILYPASSAKEYAAPDTLKIVNMAYMRTTSATKKLNIILQSRKEPSHYYTRNGTTSLGSSVNNTGGSFWAKGEVALDENSIMVTTAANQYAYYNFNDKIYRWDVTNLSNVNVTIPLVGDYQKMPDGSSMIPEGEQICAMNNFVNFADVSQNVDDTKLIVATYNPNRPGDKKGSVYVFDLTNNSLIEKYEGCFDKPVKVCYKFPI